jgi:hypothetical protein
MAAAYLTAFVVAMAASFGGVDHPRLNYWRRWDPALLAVCIAVVCAIHGCASVVVTGLADQTNWEPVPSGAGRHWLNGALYGIAAAMLLRLEITSFGLSPISPGRTLLRTGLAFFEKWLDAGAHTSVARKLGDLQPRTLGRVACRLYAQHVRPELDEDDALEHVASLHATIVRALGDARAREVADAVDAIGAQEDLRSYCECLIVDCLNWWIHLGDVPPPGEEP